MQGSQYYHLSLKNLGFLTIENFLACNDENVRIENFIACNDEKDIYMVKGFGFD